VSAVGSVVTLVLFRVVIGITRIMVLTIASTMFNKAAHAVPKKEVVIRGLS